MRFVYFFLAVLMMAALVGIAVQNPVWVTFAVWPPYAISLPFWALVVGTAVWGIVSCGLWIAAINGRRRVGYLSGDTVRRAIKQADMAKMGVVNPMGASPFGNGVEGENTAPARGKGKRK